MTRLIPIVTVLLFALAYPRIALMLAVLAAGGAAAAIRLLLRHRTVFLIGRWSPCLSS